MLIKDKIIFYTRYFMLKTFYIWFEVKRPKLKMFIYELLYSLSKIIKYSFLLPSPFSDRLVETKFGVFKIAAFTHNMSQVSPAYERGDIDYLLNLMKDLVCRKQKILFIDVGANIGTYTVTVGTFLRNYSNFQIMAFEPGTHEYDLLQDNIKNNGLCDNVAAYNLGLYDQIGDFGFQAKTLDYLISNKISCYDAIIFKIDVEGLETHILRGANGVLNSGKNVYLLVEDFICSDVIDYLKKIGAQFMVKLTPYNSWYKYCRVCPLDK